VNAHSDILLASMVGLETAHAFSAFNPSIFTIRRFPDSATARDIREGELWGVLYSVMLGLAASIIIESWWPLLFAAATDLFMVSIYEQALRSAYGSA
jgi:hypothetical protein